MRAKQAPKIMLERFKEAAKGTYGNLTAIAKRLHVSRTTIYKFLEGCPEAKALVEEAKEEFDDIAENLIQKRIIEGNDQLLIFYARTRMKHRGYSDEMNLNVNKMPEFKVTVTRKAG